MVKWEGEKKISTVTETQDQLPCKWLVRLLLNGGKAFRFVRFEIFGFAGVYTL